ncbi:FAD dependent oxidoreductase [Rhodotorula diobovata]|uniref:FAD dependent oxidoreductase n=1 Tax=Rhodotorula diobovata TaxID=5288 RepID=A0A5C5G1W3_9BASI|nr:FAD dependent oxidoreductase [Rhodotorula diobovata]
MPGPQPPQTVLIVGAGEFGATAALALAEGPYKGHGDLITLVDRGAEPPAVDAASSDYNKIVRADYSDPLYQKFALDALAEWRSPRWRKHFHECGVVVVSASSHPQATYVRNSHALNAQSSPPSVGPLHAEGDIRRFYPAGLRTGEFPGDVAYRNSVGGWAASRDAVVECIDLARALGVRFVHAEADALVHADGSTKGPVRGVRTKEGKTLEADFVILACGSWTPRLLPELATNCLPTGQTVATVKLSEDEMKEYDDMPVTLCLDTGFYCFPPNKDRILKFAIHDRGWLAPSGPLPSLPRTTLSDGYASQQIPPLALAALKRGLARVHPQLVYKKVDETRLCWYSDRESGDFMFDFHPESANLFVAAGGSGHAFKFLPLVGPWILGALQRTLPAEQLRLWSFTGDRSRLDKSRGEGPVVRRDLDSGKVVEVRSAPGVEVRAKL